MTTKMRANQSRMGFRERQDLENPHQSTYDYVSGCGALDPLPDTLSRGRGHIAAEDGATRDDAGYVAGK